VGEGIDLTSGRYRLTSYPNIITVYDIGESEAGRFIVMELVSVMGSVSGN
jgi:hypothetical protein